MDAKSREKLDEKQESVLSYSASYRLFISSKEKYKNYIESR